MLKQLVNGCLNKLEPSLSSESQENCFFGACEGVWMGWGGGWKLPMNPGGFPPSLCHALDLGGEK